MLAAILVIIKWLVTLALVEHTSVSHKGVGGGLENCQGTTKCLVFKTKTT